MSSAPVEGLALVRARDLHSRFSASLGTSPSNVWNFENLSGRLVEVSQHKPSGAFTLAANLIKHAQKLGRGVAWVAGTDSIFYPPDFSQSGVDLSRLPIVWALGKLNSLMSTELLLRSGAFGLLLVDLGWDWRINDASLGRLGKLLEVWGSAIVFLTRKTPEQASIGSLISLRLVLTRSGVGPFTILGRITRDRRHGGESQEKKVYHGPCGLY